VKSFGDQPAADPPGQAAVDPSRATDELDQLRARLRDTIAHRGYRRLDEPVELSSGGWSRDFIDVKAALSRGSELAAACRALVALAGERQLAFDAVGGLTMGADQFAHGVAALTGCEWFVVRKQPKGRGTDQLLEGAALGPATRVLLVEDVVTTGASIHTAYRAVEAAGAEVVLATALVDRGVATAPAFADLGVAYAALLTHRDFDIEAVGA
jgi:orotate phosphoribosyltransferase